MVRTGRTVSMLVLVLTWLVTLPASRAQEPAANATPSTTAGSGEAASRPSAVPRSEKPETPTQGAAGRIGRESLIALFRQANPMLWPLIVCSVVMLGFVLDRMIALRRNRVLPKDFISRFLERLSHGKLDRERAIELCKAHESPVSRVFGHAVRYWGQPAATIRQALDHDAAGEVLELRRNVRVLNATATLSPLLGLLGTVVGMIESFDAIGGGRVAGVAKSEALAHGISLALMTTALGLAIAVVSVTFYYYFLQRVDVLARELDDHARQVIDQISAEAVRPLAAATAATPVRGHIHNAPELVRPETRSLGRVDPA